MKFLVRFFISLFIFLLAGYGQVYAHTSQDTMNYAAIKSLSEPKHSVLADFIKSRDINVKADISALSKVNDKVDASDNEDEDEKPISIKKLLDNGNYYTTVFNTQTPGYFFSNVKKRLTNFKPFSSATSQRKYILFRVIRI